VEGEGEGGFPLVLSHFALAVIVAPTTLTLIAPLAQKTSFIVCACP